MCFGFKRNHTVDGFFLEAAGAIGSCWSELLYTGSLDKGNVVFVGRNDAIRVFLGCFFDELKETLFFGFPINNKAAIENLMAAVFRVYL